MSPDPPGHGGPSDGATGPAGGADGRTVGAGRYRLAGMLGRGGMAEVRLAQDTRLGRAVAIKRLRVDLADDPTFQARFQREAQSAASLNHPSIVAVYDTGEELDPAGSGVKLPYIVMEYVEGETLRDLLRAGRKILPDRALEIIASVLSALDYSHRAGIIHRDIKPANVMLTPSGDVKVMDFGIARAIADSSATMTQTAAVVGTAQYFSPEQARGEQVDARSDLYSTGCVLFELLTGRPPFVGDSPVAVAYQHVREEAPAPSSVNPEISPALDAITLKALTKSVDDRYQSATEMRADIERALEGRAVLAPAIPGADLTAPFLAPPPTESTSTTTITPASADDEPPHRRTGWWVLVGLGVAALIIAAFLVPKLLSGSSAAQSKVPSLLRLTVAQATAALKHDGLQVGRTIPGKSTAIAPGHVMRQSVSAGDYVAKGSAIDITVSTGPNQRIVPDVTTDDLATATATLKGRGFNVRPVRDPTSTERLNQVTRTDPTAGTPEPTGFTVTVYYSTGYIAVPSVVGMTQQEATATLQAKHFDAVPSKVVSDAPEGTVTDQYPHANTRHPYGSVVTIQVSLGPTTTPTITVTQSTTPTTPPTTTPTTPTTPTTTTPTTPTTPTTTTPTTPTTPPTTTPTHSARGL